MRRIKIGVNYIVFILFSLAIPLGAQTIKTELEYKVKTPPVSKDRPPVIILLHGYGSNESDLFELSNTLDSRFMVFSLRAPFLGKEVGYSWYGLEFLPNKKFIHNYQEMTESRKKVLSFISNACKEFKADSNKVYLMGYSQGAILAYDISLNAPKKIAGAVIMSGLLSSESISGKTKWADVMNTAYFIGHGNSDNVIDLSEAEKAHTLLKEKGVKNCTYKNYEMPHAIVGKELNDIKSWLSKQINPKKDK